MTTALEPVEASASASLREDEVPDQFKISPFKENISSIGRLYSPQRMPPTAAIFLRLSIKSIIVNQIYNLVNQIYNLAFETSRRDPERRTGSPYQRKTCGQTSAFENCQVRSNI